MNDALRRAMIAAGVDPEKVAAEAKLINLAAPTRKEQRQAAPVQTLGEQLGLEVGEATGIVVVQPGTKKHQSLVALRDNLVETGQVEFLGEFREAGLVAGDLVTGWTLSASGLYSLGMLDHGRAVKAERGKMTHSQKPQPDPGREMTGRYHSDGPDTERIAAAAVAPRSGTQREAVLAHLRHVGRRGATDYELHASGIGARPHVAGTRREELIADGWTIQDTGERRLTDTGTPAIVWRLYENAPSDRERTDDGDHRPSTDSGMEGREVPGGAGEVPRPAHAMDDAGGS
jgi:hypothetical protein